ncbi:MAG: hypothetical protein AAF266_14720, partial [Planctomycetota bacterium]
MSVPLLGDQRDLFDRACTGRLNDEALGRLEDLLRVSPEARREYLDYAALHADLYGAVRVARVRERLADVLEDERVVPSESSRRKPAAVLAMALATAAALLLMVSPARQQVAEIDAATNEAGPPIDAEQGEEGLSRWPGLVAKISRVESVEWPVGERRFSESEFVAAGTAVALTSGLVEIEFRQGAVVVLEGPAHLVADSANAASLIKGKLAAVAPPWATGFRIDTPGIDVIDHGTEFAVNVTG